jgi:hypothetical protein
MLTKGKYTWSAWTTLAAGAAVLGSAAPASVGASKRKVGDRKVKGTLLDPAGPHRAASPFFSSGHLNLP